MTVDYPFGYEPAGADFLSGGLTEAVLLAELLPAERFRSWWRPFATGLAAIGAPARVTDPGDGQGAHLLGLNLYRAHALRLLAPHQTAPNR